MIFKTIENGDTTKIVTALQARKIAQEELNASLAKQEAILESDTIALREYEAACSQGGATTAKFDLYMSNASTAAKEHAIATKGAAGSTDVFVAKQKEAQAELKATANAANGASIAMKALSIAGNMLAMWAISEAISFVTEKISDYVNELEIARETAEEVRSELESLNTSVSDNGNWINENASNYEKLSKGVNSLGENVSLTDEEFEEYNSLTNEIAEMFPELVTGYTDTGNAILSCKNNVDLLTEAYEKQKQAAQDAALQNADALFEGFKADTSSSNVFSNGELSKIDEYSILQDMLNSNDLSKYTRGQLNTIFKNAGVDTAGFLLGTREDYENKIKENLELLSSYARTLDSTMESATSNVTPIIDAYLDSNTDFQSLDSEIQTSIKQIADNMGYSFYSQFENQADLVNWIDNTLVPAFSNVDSQKLLSELFSLDVNNMPVGEYVTQVNSLIDEIADSVGGDSEQIKLNLGFDDSSITPLINKVEGFLSDEFDDKVGELTLDELDIASQLKIPEGTLLSWDELIEKINEAQEESSDETSILSSTEILAQVEALSAGLDQLDKIYADVYDKEDFDWSSILNNDDFTEVFSNMENVTDEYKNAYDEFIETISNSPDNIDACQQAFDNLATAYIYNSGVLDNLTEETKNSAIAMLEQMGVVNATEVVTKALAQQTDYLAISEAFAASKGKELADATWEEISAFMDEEKYSEEARAKLAELALAKATCNGTSLDFSGDISNLYNYVKILGGATSALKALNDAKNGVFSSSAMGGKEAHDALVKMAEQEVQDALNMSANYSTKANYSGGSATNSAINKASKSGSSSSEKEDAITTLDWVETLVSRIERTISNLGKTVSATYKTWSNRNNALGQELSAISNEINMQQQAYERYMAQANSVGLSDYYKNLVQNGAVDIQTIQDDTLKEQINQYTKYYEAALDCSDAVQDLRDKVADLAQTKFDLIYDEFDSKIGEIEHAINMLEGYADQTETAGYVASTKYYEALINQEKINIQSLQNEYTSLTSAFNEAVNSGAVEKDSEQWYDMKNSINEVEEAIQDANTALIEYQNTMREIEWDLFDKLEEYISKITTESDFIVDLLDSASLYDENGNLTNEGLATQGLHAVNYNTYMQQANDYASELLEIDKELANDPYNVDLIERRNELLELQQEAISNAESEKDAIKDLVSGGYDILLDALQELIDKRKEALQAEKDLYDYQKSISEQTKTIAEYEKQLQAYEGDTSEETKAKIQQIKVNLEEAQQDLKDSEYEKWLSDQEAMLDSLYDQTEEWVNARLDDLDGLIQQAIDTTNANAETISNTINTATTSVGYTITDEMSKVWDVNSGIGKVVSDYSANFSSTMTNVQSSLNSIKSLIEQMKASSDAQAAAQASAVTASSTTPVSTSSSSTTSNSSSSASTSSSSGGGSSWGSWFIHKADSYPKSKLNVDTSIVDRLKYRDYDSSFSARKSYYSAMGGSGTYTGSNSQNTWMIQQMKAHGFKNGGTIGDLISKTGESGFVLARTGEEIFSLEKIKELKGVFTAAQPLIDVSKNLNNLTALKPTTQGNTYEVQIGDIQMYGVNNVEEFGENLKYQLQNNRVIEKVIHQMTSDSMLGKNDLTKMKF